MGTVFWGPFFRDSPIALYTEKKYSKIKRKIFLLFPLEKYSDLLSTFSIQIEYNSWYCKNENVLPYGKKLFKTVRRITIEDYSKLK